MEVKLTGLELYQQRMREAKALGPEAISYVKGWYKINKKLKERTAYVPTSRVGQVKRVSLDRTVRKSDKFIKVKNLNRFLSKGLTVDDLLAKSFGIISDDAASRMVNYFLTKGLIVELDRAKYRQLTKREWDLLDEAYNNDYTEKLGLSYSEYFFGS